MHEAKQKFSPLWLTLAFLLAPIFGLVTALLPFYGASGLIMMAIFGGLASSYLSALILGLPLFILLKRRNCLLAWHFGIGGVFCALPVSVFIFSGARHITTSGLSLFLCLLGVGLCSGLCFWVIGIWLPNSFLLSDPKVD
jgi:hypothetical protein